VLIISGTGHHLYGNIFQEKDTDLRWVGEIGEICFDQWARSTTKLPVEWVKDNAAGRPDFRIGEIPLGMKTVKRKEGVKPGYTAQITARHAQEPVEHFFFASYEYPCRRLWLLGGITKVQFLKDARYYQAGEKVHANYTIREGHEIYNIEIAKLMPPAKWIASFGHVATW
jgi:hypothetical protein